MSNSCDLSRFVSAHRADYERALREINQGRKQSHWMWYIFPIMKGLGRSYTAQYYAINTKEEALAFLNDPYLGGHLKEISNALLQLRTDNPTEVFGKPDDWKLKACMTLFSSVSDNCNDKVIFENVLEKYFGGKRDGRTIGVLRRENTLTEIVGL